MEDVRAELSEKDSSSCDVDGRYFGILVSSVGFFDITRYLAFSQHMPTDSHLW